MHALKTFVLVLAAAPVLLQAQDVTPSPGPAASASPAKRHYRRAASGANAPTQTASPTPGTSGVAAKPSRRVPGPQAQQAPGGGNGQVWVNTETHAYHKEGSKWYGHTKHGKYLSEAEAQKEGYRAAKKREVSLRRSGKRDAVFAPLQGREPFPNAKGG
jgi:hypothetical protein